MLRIDVWLSKLLVGLMLGLIKIYRYFLSPWVGYQCRFYPTCSHYSEEAFKKHGFIKGFWLTIVRVAKCSPWHKGGLDEVPPRKKHTSRCCADHQHTHN